jgi:peptide/nickel transport system permease protein
MNALRRLAGEFRQYPSAIAGLVIILGLVTLAVYALISMPVSEAIRLWRAGEEVWSDNPKTAAPAWTNVYRRQKLPETLVLSSVAGTATKTTEVLSDELTDVTITFDIPYPYDAYPQELSVFLVGNHSTRAPHVSMMWLTPDGREIRVGEITPRRSDTYRFALDDRLLRRLRGVSPEQGLFADPNRTDNVPLEGDYKLVLNALLFEPNTDIDAKFVMYGQVHGIAGTDDRRRDLSVALLVGTPIALSFGLLAALGTTVSTMIIAAVGVWFGRWLDAAIQRITEVNLILPLLPILIMVGTFYSRSIWLMLGVVVALSIFGAGIKTYRAIFLQVKESAYIEAARAYGAGNGRIIFMYMIPRIVPILVPQLVVLVPSFVFLEASLAVLGLGDPVLPTWGKVINDARTQGALHNGHYYWMLQPAALLMLSGLSFAMVGFALDRIFNPRLRGL